MATFPLINSVRLDFVFFIRHWFKTLAVHYRVMMHSISSLLSLLRNFFLFLRLNELFMQKKKLSAVVKWCRVCASLLQFWLGPVHSLVAVVIVLILGVISCLTANHGKFTSGGLQPLKNSNAFA